jgi:hypothetical protein
VLIYYASEYLRHRKIIDRLKSTALCDWRKKKNYIFCCQFEGEQEIGAGDVRVTADLLGGALEKWAIHHLVYAVTGAQFVNEFLGIWFFIDRVIRHTERASPLQPIVKNNTAAYFEKYFSMFQHGDGQR